MKNAIQAMFVWLKSLIFTILSAPFLLVGAVALSLGLLGILVGLIGMAFLMLAGVVKIDPEKLKKMMAEKT
jgi:hypothetical protein